MNIFIHEMKANRKSLIIWCAGALLLIALSMAKYSALSASNAPINEIIGQIPKAFRAMLGIGDFNLATVSGYFGVMFLYLILMATIHSSMLGDSIIGKEERGKTSEFLFTKPVSRSKVMTAKFLAATVNVIIYNIVNLVSSIILVNAYARGEKVTGDIILLMIGMFILQMLFLSLGAVLAAAIKDPNVATSRVASILMGTFILAILIDLESKLHVLNFLTPFKYFPTAAVMYGGGLSGAYIIWSVALTALLVALTYRFYKKKDLHG